MTQTSKTLDEALSQDPRPIFDLMRYFLSDKVNRSLSCVVSDSDTPVQYAHHIVKTCVDQVYEKFAKNVIVDYDRIHNDIKKSWVFDRVVEVAIFYRLVYIHSDDLRRVSGAIPLSYVHPLTLHGLYPFCGLMDFPNTVDIFNLAASGSRTSDRDLYKKEVMNDIASVLGTIEQDAWLFRNPTWLSTVLRHKEIPQNLRMFLTMVIIARINSDDEFFDNFGLPTDDVLADADEFVELCRDKTTTSKDILRFFRRIDYYTTNVPKNALYYLLFEKTQGDFLEAYYQAFPGMRSSAAEPPSINRDEWSVLRYLGEDFAPERTIDRSETPIKLVDRILENCAEAVYQNIIVPTYRPKGIDLPESLSNASGIYGSFVRDNLYRLIVERRLLELNDKLCPQTLPELSFTQAQLLLIIPDEQCWLGLTLVQSLLSELLTQCSAGVADGEYDTLVAFEKSWRRLSLDKPDDISHDWIRLLNNPDVRGTLRWLAFLILDLCPYPTNGAYDRSLLFQNIKHLTTLLNGEPTEGDFATLMDQLPKSSDMVTVTITDYQIWALPYDQIEFE